YDVMFRFISETNLETGTITYKYDSDSNCASPNSSSGDLISRTDARNIRTCFQYDILHRLMQKNYSDGNMLTAFYAYDGFNNGFGVLVTNVVGRMTEAWIGISCCAIGGAEIFGYDVVGRIILNEKFTSNMSYRPVNYFYDLVGNLLLGSN